MAARKPRRTSGSRSRSSTAAGGDRRTDNDLSAASFLTGAAIRIGRSAAPADTAAVTSAAGDRQVAVDTATLLRDRLGIGFGGSRSSQMPESTRKPRPHRGLKLATGAAAALALTATFWLLVF